MLQVRASGARFAAGRPAKTISGLAPADMNGTLSTPEESAPRAPTSGLRPSVSHVGAGRRIPIGMQNERATATFIAPNVKPVKDR
jgi:hypothetical protein